MDASQVSYVMTANEVDDLPAPILDRLTIVEVREPDEAQQAVVAASLYRAANEATGRFFPADPDPAVIAALAATHPRQAQKALDDAMTRAAAQGRRVVKADDVHVRAPDKRRRIGF